MSDVPRGFIEVIYKTGDPVVIQCRHIVAYGIGWISTVEDSGGNNEANVYSIKEHKDKITAKIKASQEEDTA